MVGPILYHTIIPFYYFLLIITIDTNTSNILKKIFYQVFYTLSKLASITKASSLPHTIIKHINSTNKFNPLP